MESYEEKLKRTIEAAIAKSKQLKASKKKIIVMTKWMIDTLHTQIVRMESWWGHLNEKVRDPYIFPPDVYAIRWVSWLTWVRWQFHCL